MKYQVPRGTTDIVGEEMEQWHQVEKIIRQITRVYNYQEIRTPIFEHTELFQRSVGDTTDIVEKEMYSFDDRGNRSLTLRPEGTAGVVRGFVEKKMYANPLLTKLYYLGPMFRYENPQAGRARQFHQFGTEVFGSVDPAIDAEVIAVAMNFYRALGLRNVVVQLNSVGDAETRPRYLEKLTQYFTPYQDQLSAVDQSRLHRNPMRILDSKDPRTQELLGQAPSILDYLSTPAREHFERLQQYLKQLEIPFVINPQLVRGLDYYTMTAFEFYVDIKGAQAGTIGGGGRYNQLVGEVGGNDTPGIGFGIGLERVLLACKEQGCLEETDRQTDCFLITFDEASRQVAIPLLQRLRQAGLVVEMDYQGKKMKAQMKTADRLKARYVAILGEDELTAGKVSLKALETGEQTQVALDGLVQYLKDSKIAITEG